MPSQEKAFAFRGHCGQIHNLLQQPVPFPYFHILNLMLVITLTIVAYILVPEGDWYLTVSARVALDQRPRSSPNPPHLVAPE